MNDDLLTKLNSAATDEEREWLVLEFSLSKLDATLREAVWAAAIPHWFDASFLSVMLGQPEAETLKTFESLIKLSFIEPFPGRGYNVHERSRALLLKHSWQEHAERSRQFSERAAKYCSAQDQDDMGWRVETIYHQLMTDDPDAVKIFIRQGGEWLDQFEYAKAEALARSILSELKVTPVPIQAIGWAYFFRGYAYRMYSRYDEAKTNLESALGQRTDDEFLKANCLSSLGKISILLDKYELAHQQYEEVLKTYQKVGDKSGQANCIISLGEIYYRLDRYTEARQKYEEALQIYRELGDHLGESNCIQALGEISYILHESENARQLYEEALEIYRKVGARLGEAKCLTMLGDILLRTHQHEVARQKFEEALQICRKINNPLGEANCLRSLGDVHRMLHEYSAAYQKCEEALQIYRQVGSLLGEAGSIQQLGDLKFAQGEYKEAGALYEQARQIDIQIGNLYGEATNDQRLGNTHMSLEEYQMAQQYYQDALSIFRKINHQRGIDICFKALEEVRELMDEQ